MEQNTKKSPVFRDIFTKAKSFLDKNTLYLVDLKAVISQMMYLSPLPAQSRQPPRKKLLTLKPSQYKVMIAIH